MTEFPLSAKDDNRLYLRTHLEQLHDPENGSSIEGPLRPAIVKVGEIATYTTYGIMEAARGIKAITSKLSRKPDGSSHQKTPRNPFLD